MEPEALGQKRGSGVLVAAGLAVGWGLVTAALDCELFWRSSYTTLGLHLRYLAAAALLQAALMLPLGVGAWGVCRLWTRRSPGAGRDLTSVVSVHVIGVMMPITLRTLAWVHQGVLPRETPVESPIGIAATLGVLIPAAVLCLVLPRVVAARMADAAEAMTRLHRRLALTGFAGTLLTMVMVFVGLPRGEAGGAVGAERSNVLLISIDSVRADVWDEYIEQHASPTLRQFIESTRRFSDAWATYSGTLPSHGSMFTGLYPIEHGAVGSPYVATMALGGAVDPDLDLLAERFAAAGYETVGIMSNPFLGPPYGLEAGFQTYVNGGRAGRIGRFDPLLVPYTSLLGHYLNYADLRIFRREHPSTRLFRSWLDRRDPSLPFFCFLHYIEVHVPHNPPRELMRRYCTGPFADLNGTAMKHRFRSGEIEAVDKPAALAQLRALNLAVLDHMDRLLAPALASIEEHGLPANTLIILTSDHGDNLFEKVDDYAHSHVYNVATRVPLAIRVPGDTAGSDWDGAVSIVDFARTIYDFVGFELEGPLRGVDLLSEAPRSATEERPIYLMGADEQHHGWAYAVCSGGYTLVVNATGTHELYDWIADPQQLIDLAEDKPELAAQLRANLESAQATMQAANSRAFDMDQLPPEVLEELTALGYIGD